MTSSIAVPPPGLRPDDSVRNMTLQPPIDRSSELVVRGVCFKAFSVGSPTALGFFDGRAFWLGRSQRHLPGLRQSPAAGHGSVREPCNLGATAAEQAEPGAGHGQFPACTRIARRRWSGRPPPLNAVQADRRQGSGSCRQLGLAVRLLAGIGAPSPVGLCPEQP